MVEIRLLRESDIKPIASAFAALGWDKPASQYERYLSEQITGSRVMLVASLEGTFAGYTTIVWESGYAPLQKNSIPEIVDFNVLPEFRRQGIGTQLMEAAERRIAEHSPVAGIGVGLTADYGAAQVLYICRGYIPDGRGVHWGEKTCQHGDQVTVDHSLVLYFTKQLK
jgi:GNAT superfamily N-acetyltransferase